MFAGDQGQTPFLHILSGNDGESNAISVDYIAKATTAAEKKAMMPWVSSKLFRVGFEPMMAASGKTTVRFSPRYKPDGVDDVDSKHSFSFYVVSPETRSWQQAPMKFGIP
ncbi:MAG: hypothetical protein CVU44_22150 [Chloroflexi bacterium HGW-Chloroflexi-6]|nr:MAG: hypothetical protein CVU44_22150 [Chloroflexi bacterium HGW-Chloroflexi-6]